MTLPCRACKPVAWAEEIRRRVAAGEPLGGTPGQERGWRRAAGVAGVGRGGRRAGAGRKPTERSGKESDEGVNQRDS